VPQVDRAGGPGEHEPPGHEVLGWRAGEVGGIERALGDGVVAGVGHECGEFAVGHLVFGVRYPINPSLRFVIPMSSPQITRMFGRSTSVMRLPWGDSRFPYPTRLRTISHHPERTIETCARSRHLTV
jgi:hypothetical protein